MASSWQAHGASLAASLAPASPQTRGRLPRLLRPRLAAQGSSALPGQRPGHRAPSHRLGGLKRASSKVAGFTGFEHLGALLPTASRGRARWARSDDEAELARDRQRQRQRWPRQHRRRAMPLPSYHLCYSSSTSGPLPSSRLVITPYPGALGHLLQLLNGRLDPNYDGIITLQAS